MASPLTLCDSSNKVGGDEKSVECLGDEKSVEYRGGRKSAEYRSDGNPR